jgi:CBS domain-containing protein
MAPHPITVPPDTRLDRAVYDYLLHQDERALPVVTEARLLGLLSVGDIVHVPPEQWPLISAWRAMTPVERLQTVRPDLPLPEALRLLSEPGRDQLLVVRDGELLGILSRSRAAHYRQVRRDLGLDQSQPPSNQAGSRPAA